MLMADRAGILLKATSVAVSRDSLLAKTANKVRVFLRNLETNRDLSLVSLGWS